jgi:hypothetical protein
MDKSKRAKAQKFSLDGLKEARSGTVSRLDQLEVCSNLLAALLNEQ